MKPGKYPNINNLEYHKGPGISSSQLKKLLISGAHFQASLLEEKETSKEMTIGSLVHSMLLEPEKVEQEYFVGEFNVRRGKDYEAALKEAGNRIVVTKEEYEKATAVVEAFRIQAIDHPLFNGKEMQLLKGEKEHSYYWEDPATAVLCKCRPDNLTPEGLIVDIKTTKNATMDAFQKSIVDYGYHLSAAFYMQGVEAVRGTKPQGFAIVAIETEAPYAIQVFVFAEEALRIGKEETEQALGTYAECVATDSWLAYPQKAVEISVPQWYLYRRNRR